MKALSETYKELRIDFTFPIKITNANGKRTYYENSSGWYRIEYAANGKETFYESNSGFWSKHEYDAEGNAYYEDSYGNKRVTPRKTPRKSYNGTVLEIDGEKYELKLTTQ